MWRASENPWTSSNLIQKKPPFVCLLIPGTWKKKAPLLRCSCRIGWNKWSLLTMSSISMAFWVMTCSVSKGAYTTNLPPKYSFKSPITKRSCDKDHHKECKTPAKDSRLPRWLLKLTRFFEQACGSTSTASPVAEKYVGIHDGPRWHEVKCQWEDFTSHPFNRPNAPSFSTLRDQHTWHPPLSSETWFSVEFEIHLHHMRHVKGSQVSLSM